MNDADLPPGWTVWHDRPDDIVVLAYRPDLFDGSNYPAACLPTIAIKPERLRGPRGKPRPAGAATSWTATLTLEPDVVIERRTASEREAAIETARALASAFVSNEYDLRSSYPDPHQSYLERLEATIQNEE